MNFVQIAVNISLNVETCLKCVRAWPHLVHSSSKGSAPLIMTSVPVKRVCMMYSVHLFQMGGFLQNVGSGYFDRSTRGGGMSRYFMDTCNPAPPPMIAYLRQTGSVLQSLLPRPPSYRSLQEV